MRFIDAVNRDAFGRAVQRLANVCLSATSIVFALMLAMNLSREPIVIERGCDSRVIQVASSKQSIDEIVSFVKSAVRVRFESEPGGDPGLYLAHELQVARQKEQIELKGKGIDQRILVRSVAIEKNGDLTIAADRVVAAGPARSAIPIRLKAKVASKERSESNPFGLVLTSVEEVRGD